MTSGSHDHSSSERSREDGGAAVAPSGRGADALLTALEDLADAVREHLVACRCGDSGCVHGAEGMCTNGGCRCFLEQPGLAKRARLRRRQTAGDVRRALARVDEMSRG